MFTEQEIRNRINKVADGMAKKGLDALICIDTETPFNSGNVRYLSNYFNGHRGGVKAVIVVPPDIILCIPPGFFNSSFRIVQQQSPWIKEVFGTGMGLWGLNFGRDIRNALEKAKCLNKNVAVDGIKWLTEDAAKNVREELKDVKFIENTGIVEQVRVIKSPSEIEVIRKASECADVGVNAWHESIKEGRPQFVTAITAEQAARLAGAEEAQINTGAGTPWIWGKYRGREVVYKKGDMASTEFNAIYEGYYGQVNRTCIVGKPTDKQKAGYDALFDAYQAMASICKPGARACDLYLAGEKIIKDAGFPHPGMRSGHGMGLTMGEGFDLDVKEQMELKPGHYVMIHNIISMPNENINATIGNALIVTEKGSEELNKAKYQMYK